MTTGVLFLGWRHHTSPLSIAFTISNRYFYELQAALVHRLSQNGDQRSLFPSGIMNLQPKGIDLSLRVCTRRDIMRVRILRFFAS
jgi:hypothetical protein